MKIQFFKNLIKRHNRNTTPNLVSGFTIVEAIVAVFILSISISAMLGLTVSSYSSAKYANNELTANYLLQEAVDAIRNSRDTMVFQKSGVNATNWSAFLTAYGKDTSSSCFSNNGCGVSVNSYFTPGTPSTFVSACTADTQGLGGSTIPCSALQYDDSAQGGSYYSSTSGSASRFKRQVKMVSTDANKVEVTVTVEYPNGTTFKIRTLKMNLLNWQN